ncbi:MAG TPA: thiamine-phosphate kinase [Gammaproteobacteria bacterium]|nr:thiamine-phosphate kinase [Gammaproteobacteria bacterium]
MSEFDLINQYFKTLITARDDVLLGPGDDCALLAPPPGKALAVSTDTLISGVHFPAATQPEDIGYKALAVNLSDLAAMGAEPAWASLSISLPEADECWVERFMRGFNELARAYKVALIGGDTTRGPLSITINITGFVTEKTALRRSSARDGDLIFMTGTLGDAGVGLNAVLNNNTGDKSLAHCINRLNRPEPRIQAGLLLTQLDRVAAIDISDGLLADLSHICDASQTGAIINLDKIPLSDALVRYYQGLAAALNHEQSDAEPAWKPDWQAISCSGDDYELCFSCSEQSAEAMWVLFKTQNIQVAQIGRMTASARIECQDEKAVPYPLKIKGFNHFSNEK